MTAYIHDVYYMYNNIRTFDKVRQMCAITMQFPSIVENPNLQNHFYPPSPKQG